MKIEKKVQIYKPLTEVFNFVTEVTTAPSWSGMLEKVVVTSEGPIRVGSKGYNVMKLLWKTANVGWVITGLEPNLRFMIRATSGPIYGLYYYRFEEEENTTLLSLRVEVEPRGVFKVLEPIFGPAVQLQIGKDLDTLKEILEIGTGPLR